MARPPSTQHARQTAETIALILREKVLAEQYGDKLKPFLKAAWPVIETASPFVDGWHIDCLCDHVQALLNREIRDLIINIPPRSTKSTIISIAAPAWRWIKRPEERFLCGSFSRKLALNFSRQTRELIKSPWYQTRWADRFRILTGDQDEKGEFVNDKGGYRLSTSVEGGGALGRGGSVRIYDDPNDLREMKYAEYRQSVKDWYSGTMSSRHIDPKTDVSLLVQQRASYGDDLTSFLRELGWVNHVVIPNEFDGRRPIWPIGRCDPRINIGDLLCPERMGPEETAKQKRESRDNYCTPGYTPILMSDWSEKKIEDVQVGDEVVGYERGDRHKTYLKRATVQAVNSFECEVFRYTTASGRTFDCTSNHKWYNRRDTGREMYTPAQIGTVLHSVYMPIQNITHKEQRLYDWLGGIIDGEGSCQERNLISISQSERNTDIQNAIKDTLSQLGFTWAHWSAARSKNVRHGITKNNPKWANVGIFYIHGGRSSKIKILAHSRMVKRQRIIDNLWASSGRLTESNRKDGNNHLKHKVVSIQSLGNMTVYGLTTTTGNYVAWGFASQNSGQFQQSPVSDTGGVVKREWFRFWNPSGVKRVDSAGNVIPVRIQMSDGKTAEIDPIELPPAFEQTLQSWDFAFKNSEHNDYVAGHVWGRVGANSFLVARDHGHMSFTASKAAIKKMSQQYPVPQKLVEDKANGTAIMDELRNEIPGLIAVEPYGSKESRYAAISGYIEAGNVFLPNPDIFPWVWDVLAEFCDGRSAKHDDDRDAMAQALKRLYDSMAQSGVPEFRVQPRINEPESACHVAREVIPSTWRRFVAIAPGAAALWMAETPSGSLRVLRELSLDGVDAAVAGREIGRLCLPDAMAKAQQLRVVGKKQAYDLLFPKEAFAAIEPIGSYAEMIEKSMLAFEPEEGNWDYRNAAKIALREAHFRSDIVEEQDASIDRLRSLLAFQPPDFKEIPYNRAQALALAETDLGEYQRYMRATENLVTGEWPKIRFSPECPQLIAELGSFRRDKPDEVPNFVRALLLAVCSPLQTKPRELIETKWPIQQKQGRKTVGGRFAMR